MSDIFLYELLQSFQQNYQTTVIDLPTKVNFFFSFLCLLFSSYSISVCIESVFFSFLKRKINKYWLNSNSFNTDEEDQSIEYDHLFLLFRFLISFVRNLSTKKKEQNINKQQICSPWCYLLFLFECSQLDVYIKTKGGEKNRE